MQYVDEKCSDVCMHAPTIRRSLGDIMERRQLLIIIIIVRSHARTGIVPVSSAVNPVCADHRLIGIASHNSYLLV